MSIYDTLTKIQAKGLIDDLIDDRAVITFTVYGKTISQVRELVNYIIEKFALQVNIGDQAVVSHKRYEKGIRIIVYKEKEILSIQDKWAAVLNCDYPKITDPYKKQVIATLLENRANEKQNA